MSAVQYVVDTGYLCAWYAVQNHATEEETAEVHRRMQQANAAGHHLFVPVAVLFELGAQIARLENGRRRFELAQDVMADIATALDENQPRLFYVEPEPTLEQFAALWRVFTDTHVQQGHSLADTAVVELAARLKQRCGNLGLVHIWTWERRAGGVRSFSPDPETAPFPP